MIKRTESFDQQPLDMLFTNIEIGSHKPPQLFKCVKQLLWFTKRYIWIGDLP